MIKAREKPEEDQGENKGKGDKGIGSDRVYEHTNRPELQHRSGKKSLNVLQQQETGLV